MKLAQLIEDYVAVKRAAGSRFQSPATILRAFARAAGACDLDDLGQDMVLAFLNGAGPIRSSWHFRHSTLNGLFRFARERGLLAAAPLPSLLPKRPPYAPPYIYSAEELRRILDAADGLDVRYASGQSIGIPALTFRTLILLLYGAGLRLSEAVGLTVEDVDLAANLLLVRNTKFFKTRLLPIGPRLSAALGCYAEQRQDLVRRPPSGNAFFLNRQGVAMSRASAEHSFRIIRARIGLKREDGAYFQPRLHDLRHTFAVHRLLAWYRQGANVQLLLPQLSTYLGHFSLAETQAYLTMTPDLLREAGCCFERYANLEARP